MMSYLDLNSFALRNRFKLSRTLNLLGQRSNRLLGERSMLELLGLAGGIQLHNANATMSSR